MRNGACHVGSQGLTGNGHGWDTATNTIYFTPTDPRPCDNSDSSLIRGYFREVAHLFYDVGADNLDFGPQCLRQANVGLALWQAGSESTGNVELYDALVFRGEGQDQRRLLEQREVRRLDGQ